MGDFCRACGTEGTRRGGLCWDCYRKPGQLELKHCPRCGGTEFRTEQDVEVDGLKISTGPGRILCAKCPDERKQVDETNLRRHLESLMRLRGGNA